MSYELLSFLDAYSSYHQINLAIDDEEKTSFITPFGSFCYIRMAFSLKNRGRGHISEGHTDHLRDSNQTKCRAYIDDVVVKSKKHGGLFNDLKETFDNLHKYRMIFNPKKCVFGVSSGKLLSYMVSAQGIDAIPKKVKDIEQLHPPQTRREIQKLTHMMVALSQFISKLGERGMPFYKLLRKEDGFQWDDQITMTSIKLKQYLKSLPTLVPPKQMIYYYYMSQPPMQSSVQLSPLNARGKYKSEAGYFVSKILKDAQTRYPQV
jgi:hypothetical protein